MSLCRLKGVACVMRMEAADPMRTPRARNASFDHARRYAVIASARRAKLAEQARTMTFRQCAKLYLDLHQDGWKSAKHREQWASSLKNYVFPVLGDLSVADID